MYEFHCGKKWDTLYDITNFTRRVNLLALGDENHDSREIKMYCRKCPTG